MSNRLFQHMAGSKPTLARMPAITMLRRLGLTNGLKLCLDAGDANSYTSGEPWLDTSGNGYDFNRGTTSETVMLVSDNKSLHPPVERRREDIDVVGKVIWRGVKE